MLKKRIAYTDYNGAERTEDFYFNLSKAEVMEMEMSISGGLAQMITRIVEAQDAPSIIKIFKELILKAYGEKSPDGKRFIKSEELSQAFSQTEAYSELFMELSTDAQAAAEFVNGVIPNDVAKKSVAQAAAEFVNGVIPNDVAKKSAAQVVVNGNTATVIPMTPNA